MLDAAAAEYTGRPLGLTGRDLTEVLDPRQIVATRTAAGGAAPEVVEAHGRLVHRAPRGRCVDRPRRSGWPAFDAPNGRSLVDGAAVATGPPTEGKSHDRSS